MTDTAEAPAAPAPPTGNPTARRRWLTVLGAVALVAAIIWAIMHFLFAKPEQETDDAYVAGDIVAITARDAAQVTAIHADNTQTVKAGQPLIDFDDSTAQVNLAAAAADLARAVRSTRADFTRVNQSGANVVQMQAELSRANDDYRRRRGAAAQGAISGEELAHAADAVTVAKANLGVAQAQAAQSQTTVQGTKVETSPAVLTAIAAYRRAAIILTHMHLGAPIDGVIAQRTVQLGQQVAAGSPLMAIVPLNRAWIDANFRETQLRDLRIGQATTVSADIYGSGVVYHGHVIGIGAGSGSAFALLPPQNASGNWIKIVQRVPVRIGLDPKELNANPLRIGLSVKVTVDTADKGGPRLGSPGAQPYTGTLNDQTTPATEARIRQIIAENR